MSVVILSSRITNSAFPVRSSLTGGFNVRTSPQVDHLPDDQNNTRIDGVSTTHIQLPHVTSYIPTLESIQEVNVVTNSMDAEQGLAGGAAVNVQTRSGSNVVHGSGFEYHTDQNLKAWPVRFDDAALNTGKKPKQSYNEFGGTVGGPLKTNKAFYLSATSPFAITRPSTELCRCRCRRC
jgi:hypothetical protein